MSRLFQFEFSIEQFSNFHLTLISSARGTAKYILLGEHDLSNDNHDRPLQVEIAEKIPHPQFKRSAKYYDIALLKMALRITLSPYIRPACLPERLQYQNEHAVASGWGRTDYHSSTSQVLMKVTLELFTERECNATYADAARTNQLRFGIIPAQQFCAGSHTEKKDTCQVIMIAYAAMWLNWFRFWRFCREIRAVHFKLRIRTSAACTLSWV